ncbi:MAG: hypothetical protein A2951_00730 [Candidatus Buchananbacteria bacterium RIFCSPLOWO2_01_FULL_56_15]|uniref:Uncharacterized protein n=2 Tax=Candidatus Buchananiibacteriota TaxID=1817903 RepID=A0A1G1YG20_9BACT|nr:MAG: hypothetical protein A3J59_02890 [Candidatus Buchananbacteria bacterium RIFCSPHIGHO2_02_FULL_56_16]OGY54960.1 MAG: hypothetical protein A2951_00730 [Candidatus Buchananbacteria bacterium RIFCSPLOWO2_01_FULL_56_15]
MSENREKPWRDNPEDEKFYNEDYLIQIFEEENEEEIKKAAEIHQWSQDRINSWKYYIPLRRKTIEQTRQNSTQRIADNPVPTAAEISMGCYIEKIEPQVREAVVELRSKGYATFLSGFDADGQRIVFECKDLKDFQLPQDLKRNFLEKGVDLSLEDNEIRMTFYNFFTLKQIKKFWDQISSVLPDLSHEAPICLTNAAKEFRNVRTPKNSKV